MRPIRTQIIRRDGNRLWLAVIALVVVALACQDVTPPATERRLLPATPHRSTVVTPGNMQGWVFYDDQHDTLCTVATVCQLVQGPAPVPLGSGSAELATPTASDGKALLLPAYAGTRFDSITDLHYSTYRQTADPGNNLAIALQFNVDYDLTDTAHAYQGRIVFEPYQGIGGNVPQNMWQTWDAKAGKWWGTKSSVRKNGGTVTNPCVQATPCTWAQLLAAFPDIGVHATLGAVVLKAGSNWAGFRGNVDQLVVGVGGTTTVFDFELQAPLVHLHTSIPASVAGTRLPADSDYTPGAVINFNFSPAAGHDSVVVVVDDTLASASGTIVMNGPRTLETDADTIVVPTADVVDLETRITGLLTASDPRAAYSDFLQWYLDRSRVIGIEPLREQLDLATHLAIDPYRDANALRAFDDAMAGTVNVVDRWGGADYAFYYAPEDYGGGAVANSARLRQGTQLTPGHTGTHRVPANLLTRRSTQGPGAGRTQSATQNLFVPWTSEPIAIIYVNGVFTPDVAATPNEASAFHTMKLLENLVYSIPGVVDQDGYSSYVEVDHFYNRNLSAQLAAYDSAHVCIARNALRLNIYSALVGTVKYAQCKGTHYVKYLTENDIAESIVEFVQNRLPFPAALTADVGNLAAFIKNEYHDFGYHTILVTHSQGNMLAEAAERQLPDLEQRPLEARYCTAQLTMASPLKVGQFHLDNNYLRGFDIHHDVLEFIGFKNDFQHVDTDTSRAFVADSTHLMAIHALPEQMLANAYRWASKIHGVDYNYLTYPASIELLQSLLGELKDECVAGSIQVTPNPAALSLGDSLKATVTVKSRADHVLISRRFIGAGVRANLRSDSTIIAPAPTNGTEIVPVLFSSTGAVLGHVSVTVPSVPFSGTVRQYLTTTWVDTAAFSRNDSTSGIPPYPPSPPTWDGTPADCSKGVRTTAGTSWTDWAERCGRGYVIDVPADPMPIRVKLRVQFTNYLNGELGGELDSLLAPGVPVLDTVSTCNETYCVRAAIVQTLNMSNTLITSDTVCLSDRCGASQDRLKSPTTLAPATRTKRIPPPVAGPEATMRSFVRPDSTGIRPSLRPPVHP